MPLRSLQRDRLAEITFDGDDAWITRIDYLKSIDELLLWFPSREPQTRRPEPAEEEGKTSKLLVCHDFKGGYTESLFERGYSFEFWHLIDTFIYFSHNRVTLPPRGWIEAGHRRGVKVLGTLIFEWEESKADLCKCLYQGSPYGDQPTFVVDSAEKLIRLAQEYGFDGYLLNIETDLNFIPPEEFYTGGEKDRKKDEEDLMAEKELYGMKAVLTPRLRQSREDRMRKNARALEDWTSYIRNEGKRLVGSHFEIIWYDSVTTEGKLQWQDALTPLNAPFFLAAEKIFTNYTWASPPPPSPPGEFQPGPEREPSYHPKLLQSSGNAKSLDRSPSDVFEGIDVFGRNCYGGFDISKSLDMIFPTDLPPLGLSVAIFAPGWTWERAKDDGTERSWSEWWNDDLRLWVGPSADNPNPTSQPIGAYFGPRQRFNRIGDPKDICRPFYTNFGRGSGTAWWMSGRKVFDSSIPNDQLGRSGWTDIGASFALPDRLWPQMRALCQSNSGGLLKDEPLRLVGDIIIQDATLIELDAWQGSTSLKFTLASTTMLNDSPVPFLTIPICTLQNWNLISEGDAVIVVIMMKVSAAWEHLEVSPELLWANDKPHNVCSYMLSCSSTRISRSHVTDGWYRIETVFKVKASTDSSFTTPVVGLRILPPSRYRKRIRQANPHAHLLIGSITVSPERQIAPAQSGLAHWKPLSGPDESSPLLWGLLSWDKEEKYRDSGYFDIVVSVIPDLDAVSLVSAEEDIYFWLGSSTAEKQWNSFVVCGFDLTQIPNFSLITKSVTFYVVHVGITTEMPLYKLTMEIIRE